MLKSQFTLISKNTLQELNNKSTTKWSMIMANKLKIRRTDGYHYNLGFDVDPMNTVRKSDNKYIKAKDLVNGTIFRGRRVPSKIVCFYNIKPLEISWKYDSGNKQEECDGNTDYCYLVKDDMFCPKGFYLCLPHNNIVDWRVSGLDHYFLSPQEFEEDEKMTMEEYGVIQKEEHMTSYNEIKVKQKP
tara:strand:- start:2603 stop:3163 length:561 start_codon:yes stop_codon:yes gene_type:complete